MAGDFIEAIDRSESVFWILLQALPNEVFAVVRHRDTVLLGIWEEYWLRLDQVVHFLVVWRTCVEWRETNDHFVS